MMEDFTEVAGRLRLSFRDLLATFIRELKRRAEQSASGSPRGAGPAGVFCR
jgi:hypothetical protein